MSNRIVEQMLEAEEIAIEIFRSGGVEVKIEWHIEKIDGPDLWMTIQIPAGVSVVQGQKLFEEFDNSYWYAVVNRRIFGVNRDYML